MNETSLTANAPSKCRRAEPYIYRIEYRCSGITGRTAAQAAIIRKALSIGHRIETEDGRPVKEARSNGGKLQIRTNGAWLDERPLFVHP